ncbi:hypothetical protein PoB_003845700 [Plakobranchus ocellatus]|uniref:Uncharacterized protein n=1 Tax=Plakobranchus ocellatus TaxID=259542 RepID=A0AAV4AY11_9GAST|nr:hypothetical protein PoB_003845700 [Plakobranchus ocellatus]
MYSSRSFHLGLKFMNRFSFLPNLADNLNVSVPKATSTPPQSVVLGQYQRGFLPRNSAEASVRARTAEAARNGRMSSAVSLD